MVEGAPLLREYTRDGIEGSNPFLSATTDCGHQITRKQCVYALAKKNPLYLPHYKDFFQFDMMSNECFGMILWRERLRFPELGSGICHLRRIMDLRGYD